MPFSRNSLPTFSQLPPSLELTKALFPLPRLPRRPPHRALPIFSAGIMAAQLLTGRFPFDDRANPFRPSLTRIW